VLSVAAPGLLSTVTDDGGSAGLAVDTAPVASPAHGTLALSADGSFVYTPAADFSGSDSFTVSVTDGQGATTQATVGINVGECGGGGDEHAFAACSSKPLL
jgi:VCBS repeat-containing protein